MPDGMSSSLQSILGQMPDGTNDAALKGDMAAADAGRQAIAKKGDEVIAAEEETAANKKQAAADNPGALKPPELKPFVPPQQTPVADKFGSTAMMIATLGSLFTRGHATNALNAGAGVLKAFGQADTARQNQAFEEWKANTDNLIKAHQFELDAYKAALENADVDEKSKLAELNTLGYVFQNTAVQQIKTIEDFKAYQQGMEKGQAELEKVHNEADNWKEMHQAYQAVKTAMQLPDTDPTKPAKMQQAKQLYDLAEVNARGKVPELTSKPLNPQVQAFQKFAEEHPDATSAEMSKFIQSSGRPRSALSAAVGKYMDEHPDASAEDITTFMADTAAKTAATTAPAKADAASLVKLVPQKNAIESFENTALANGDVLVDLAKKVDLTGLPVIERWIRAGRKATGDPDVAAFNTQIFLYGAEVAKILTNPNLTGVLSDSARNEVSSFLPSNISAGQLERVHSLLKADFGRRKTAITNQIEQVKGDLKNDAVGKPNTDTSTTTQHKVGDIVPGKDGKRYRIIGGNMSDPDVEEVK